MIFKEISSIFTDTNKMITVTAKCIYETPKAILLEFNNKKEWLPKKWLVAREDLENKQVKIKVFESQWSKKFS